jgi:hypothetical protein
VSRLCPKPISSGAAHRDQQPVLQIVDSATPKETTTDKIEGCSASSRLKAARRIPRTRQRTDFHARSLILRHLARERVADLR